MILWNLFNINIDTSYDQCLSGWVGDNETELVELLVNSRENCKIEQDDKSHWKRDWKTGDTREAAAASATRSIDQTDSYKWDVSVPTNDKPYQTDIVSLPARFLLFNWPTYARHPMDTSTNVSFIYFY